MDQNSRVEDRDRFDFYLRRVIKQALHFDQHHRGKMFAQMRAIAAANLFAPLAILRLIGNIHNQPCDLLRGSARLRDNCHDIRERAIELRHEICADDRLFLVPADLSGDE